MVSLATVGYIACQLLQKRLVFGHLRIVEMHAILFFPGRTITQCNNTGLEQVLTQQKIHREHFSSHVHSLTT